jgi:hypothetical protein
MAQSTAVYKNVKTGQFLVQPCVRGSVGSIYFGDPIVFTCDEINDQIALAVQDCLDGYSKNKYDPTVARDWTPEEAEAFRRTHIFVSISRLQSGDLEIYPMLRRRGGYSSLLGQPTRVEQSKVDRDFKEALREAFRRAG